MGRKTKPKKKKTSRNKNAEPLKKSIKAAVIKIIQFKLKTTIIYKKSNQNNYIDRKKNKKERKKKCTFTFYVIFNQPLKKKTKFPLKAII